MNSYQKGKFAEFIARWYMRLKGYSIISCNYVTGKGSNAGEIDFIAGKGKLLVFVEVKQRRNIKEAAYSISSSQKQRIIRGAQSFLLHTPQYRNFDMRFDCILIKLPFKVMHIPNAWYCEIR